MTQHFDTSFIIIYLVFIIFSARCSTVNFQTVDVQTIFHAHGTAEPLTACSGVAAAKIYIHQNWVAKILNGASQYGVKSSF